MISSAIWMSIDWAKILKINFEGGWFLFRQGHKPQLHSTLHQLLADRGADASLIGQSINVSPTSKSAQPEFTSRWLGVGPTQPILACA